jgi:integrase
MAIRVLVRSKGSHRDLLLYFVDPLTGKEVSKTAGTRDKRDAERAAAVWELELKDYRGELDDGWKYFVDRYRDEHLARRSKKNQEAALAALGHYLRLMSPARVSDVTPTSIDTFQARLAKDVRPASVMTYTIYVLSAVKWAASRGMVDKPLTVNLPKQSKRVFMRGRPLTELEYRAMLKKCPTPELRRFLELLWHSGLRISEAMRLSWDRPPILVDLAARPYPTIRYYAEGHKAGRDDVVPMTPELSAWLAQTPPRARVGLVAPVPHKAQPHLSMAITAIGKAVGIVVNDDGRIKYASAHDFRRAFGTRWAQKVMPAVLKVLMRHADIQTTLRFYVNITIADAGAAIWGQEVPTKVPRTRDRRAKAG